MRAHAETHSKRAGIDSKLGANRLVAAEEQYPVWMNSATDRSVASFRPRGKLSLDGEREGDRSEQLDELTRRGESLPVAH
jgi:hypothetical protein